MERSEDLLARHYVHIVRTTISVVEHARIRDVDENHNDHCAVLCEKEPCIRNDLTSNYIVAWITEKSLIALISQRAVRVCCAD